MSILFYRRPDYVTKAGGPLNSDSCQKYAEKAACSRASIPKQLSFDRVIENKTLPPCSLQDFLDYLVYVAHDAENLQFYLWLKDYTKRFSALPRTQQELSPQWEANSVAPDLIHPGTSSIEEEPYTLDKDVEEQYISNLRKIASASQRPPPLPTKDTDKDSNVMPAMALSTPKTSLDWNGFSRQPFRDEVSQIITHYLLPNSPRELNLSHKTRALVLHALHRTTHPSALAPIETLTALTLRHHAHPNFIRWSLCNGNKPRVFLLRSLAVTVLSTWVVAVLLLVFSHKSRWLRIAVSPLLWFGITNLIAAAKGLCVLLHRLHTREAHPWELGSEETLGPDPTFADTLAQGYKVDSPQTRKSSRTESTSSLCKSPTGRPSFEPGVTIDLEALPATPKRTIEVRMSPLGPGNEWKRDEIMEKWKKMNWWQKARVRKVWMKEEGLRVMQNRIVVQAELWALLVTITLTTAMVACPVGSLY